MGIAMRIWRAITLAISLMLPPWLVLAAETAMVEEVSGPAAKMLQPFDSLSNGQVVELGDGVLTLSYVANCRRETISGGRVTVGINASALAGGRLVAAQEPPCKASAPKLLADAREAGTGVKRHAGQAVEAPASAILRTSTPVFSLPVPARLRVWNLSGLLPALVWEGEAAATFSYPYGAPLLRSGIIYSAEAMAADGRSWRADFNFDPGIEAGYAETVQLR